MTETASGLQWGGRFSEGPDPEMFAYSASITTDMRLLPYEARITEAHAHALVDALILSEGEGEKVAEACRLIAANPPPSVAGDEDIHGYLERLLCEELGDLGKKVHTGRSRNELVAADMRLFCRDAAGGLIHATKELVSALVEQAEAEGTAVMPGYTHLQRAQPVTLAFHLLAHAASFVRDAGRFGAAASSADVSPLGAGALAGTTLGLDALKTGAAAGFGSIFENAMDAVADRDFAADLVYACSLCAVHLSRLSEEVILWATSEFAFARIDDAWSTGSSLMPQKKNPDVAEITRSRAGRTIGDLAGLLAILKGVPFAYNRDLQEANPLVFDVVDRTLGALGAMAGLVRALSFEAANMQSAAGQSGTWSTDLAEALVGRGVAFRDAHEAVGRAIAEMEKGVDPTTLFEAAPFQPTDAQLMDGPQVERRRSHGGPAAAQTAAHIATLRSWIGDSDAN